MSNSTPPRWRQELIAKILLYVADRASRNNTAWDRACRWLLRKVTYIEPAKDFMRDPIIDNDEGFDPDELDRYQRGESVG